MRHLLLPLIVLLACSCAGTSGVEEPTRPDSGIASPAADGGPSSHDQGATGAEAAAPATPVVGIAVIDVQQTFISGAADKDINAIVAGTRTIFELASTRAVPFLISYEHSKTQSGYTLPPTLKEVLPGRAEEFIKTTFAATGQPAFAAAVKQHGLTHVILLGAETDVCVLQTVLGLRKLGLGVTLLEDTVFTSEPNTGPALRRLKQAGVQLAKRAEVAGFLDHPGDLPAPPAVPIRLVDPLGVAIVLNHLDDATLAGSKDPRLAAKQARLRELLLISEWFNIPLFGTSTTLPASLKSLVPKQVVRPLADLAAAAAGKQLVVAGGDQQLTALVGAQRPTHEVFVMEDALLSVTGADQSATLEPLYQAGAVPLTYKTFYYEMTRSIDPQQWPSPSWLTSYTEYYNKTKAPEDLPPMI